MFIVWLTLRAGDKDPFFPLGMLVLMLHKSMSCFCFKQMKIGNIFPAEISQSTSRGQSQQRKKQRFS